MRPRFHPADHGDFYAEPEVAPAAELRAVDCNTPEQWLRAIDCVTPEQWAQWARERMERDDPMGYRRGERW